MFLHLSVSHSVHGGGGSTWGGTPTGQVHPPEGTLPGRYTPWVGTPPGQVHLLWAGTLPPLWQVHTPGNACWDTVNKRRYASYWNAFLSERVSIYILSAIQRCHGGSGLPQNRGTTRCPSPHPPFYFTTIPHGYTVYLGCEFGRTLVGPTSSTCQNGTWDNRPGSCESEEMSLLL